MLSGGVITLPLATSGVHRNGSHSYSHRRQLANEEDPPAPGEANIAPLYRGFGTHFAFIYVGSPPQRVSVIVDTGSHHTAFPCKGCNCGKHMNELFDVGKSSSAQLSKCARKGSQGKCVFSQSYSEGSSWRAYKVTDLVWVGGSSLAMVQEGAKLSSTFMFGCIESETGLFRNQIVDGIMGMSAAKDTLPFKLFDDKITKSRAFSMCFRVGGGVLTLGGLNKQLNLGNMEYVKLLKQSGWFTVRLLEVMLVSTKGSGNSSSIITRKVNANHQQYNTGKGCIIDSGTTDTYLPSSISKSFTSMFRELSGMNYDNKPQVLTVDKLANLPSIVFTLEGTRGKVVIKMPPESYAEELGPQRYAFRVYVNEPQGTVLGANFMNNHNILFDIDGKRVGFAPSKCVYNDIVPAIPGDTTDESVNKLFNRKADKKIQKLPNANKQQNSTSVPSSCDDKDSKPLELCSAICLGVSKAKVVRGTQRWSSSCSSSPISKECSVVCENDIRTRGTDPGCAVGPWSSCSQTCEQTRLVASRSGGENCVHNTEMRNCYQARCAKDSDAYLSVDMSIIINNVRKSQWSYALSEDIEYAVSKLVDAPAYAVRLDDTKIAVALNSSSSISLNINARISPSNSSIKKIRQTIFDEKSKLSFLATLYSSKEIDWRFLRPNSLSLHLNTIAKGSNIIDLSVTDEENHSSVQGSRDSLYFVSVAIGVFLVTLIVILLYRYMRALFRADAYNPRGQSSTTNNRYKKVVGKK